MKRDTITKEQALARMNAQNHEEFYKINSDFTVINDGRDIENQINKILEEILGAKQQQKNLRKSFFTKKKTAQMY